MTDQTKAAKAGIVARRRTRALIRGVVGVAGAGLGLSPLSAFAAEGSGVNEAEQKPLPHHVTAVIVTGARKGIADNNATLSKLPSNLSDIPQSITVLSKPLLQSQGANSLADALRDVPGITIGGAEGGQIGNNINLNGFTARTDIFLDGLRDRGQYYRDTFALDSVEVLMGPSSMLFGRGSTGGAINQVSKRPGLKPMTEIDISATSNGLVRATADLNAPLSDDEALRIAVMGQGGPASTRRKTTVDDYGVAPSYRIGIGRPTEITVSGLLQHNTDRPDYGVSPLNGQPVKSGFGATYGYADDRTIQDVRAVSGEVKHQFEGGQSLRDQLQFNGVDTDARETAAQGLGTVSGAGYAAFSPAGISALPLSHIYARLQSHDRVIHDTSLFNQLEATADATTGPFKHSLLIGAELGHDDYRNQTNLRTGTCNGVALPAGYTGCVHVLDPAYTNSPIIGETPTNLATGKADTAAVYINDVITVLPQLKFVGGVRYDRYAATITNSLNSGNSVGNTSFARLNQTVNYTGVRGGLLWRPGKKQAYYVSYSTSFNPSLEQLTSTTGISQPLQPETNRAYEVGGKWDLRRDQLHLTAAAFQITQFNSRSQNADNTYSANGNIRVNGVRLGMAGRVTSRWQVFGGYTHLDAKIVSAIAVGTLGKVPTNTPRDTVALWNLYDVNPQWQIGGGATYMSKRFLNNTDLVSVPDYVRWDATVAYRQPHYEVRLNLFNLFDAQYYDSLIQSDGGRAAPGSGRTAMLSLVFRR